MENSLTQICPTLTVASRTPHGALLRVALEFLTVSFCIDICVLLQLTLVRQLPETFEISWRKKKRFEGLKQKPPNSRYLPNRGTRPQRPDPASRMMKSAGEEGRGAQESPGVVGDTGHHVAPGWPLYYCRGTVFAVGKS